MQQTRVQANQRIAKNTILLYLRMLFTMAVSLYTSRVVLNTLGVVDYGIYNVVGGVVSMFTFLNSAMVTSTQRYLTFELGRGNHKRLQEVFTTSFYIHIIIAFLIVILSETIGLWFFYEKMVIPTERMVAAMWVFQLSIVTMIINVMSVPYNAAIVAHEKMGAFAVISILEVTLKLLIVYLLVIGSFDKLILYAVLTACVQLFVRFIYTQYSHRHFFETHLLHKIDYTLMKEMGKFAGWNVWGNMAAMLYGTGINMLLNVFFGPVVNAARGIAVTVESSVSQFSTNFLMAVNPQITKLYAQGNIQEMHLLIFRASKFTCFLLFALSLPILIETETILRLWLKIVPDYTVSFLRLLLIIVIINGMARPFMTAAAATGDVKRYQAIIGGVLLAIVPIAYIILKFGGNPTSVYIVYLCVAIVAFFTRLIIIRSMINLSLRTYFNDVLLKAFSVCLSSSMLMIVLKNTLPSSTIWSLSLCVIGVVVVILISYFCGLTSGERSFVNSKCAAILSKLKTDDSN